LFDAGKNNICSFIDPLLTNQCFAAFSSQLSQITSLKREAPIRSQGRHSLDRFLPFFQIGTTFGFMPPSFLFLTALHFALDFTSSLSAGLTQNS
jgi:hypothetical protein